MKSTQDMTKFSFASGANAAFIDELYSDYLKDPNSVDESWRFFFEGFEFAASSKTSAEGSGDSSEAKVEAFINLYRRLGHLSADLSPLEKKPAIASDLLPENHGLANVKDTDVFHPANLPVSGPMTFGEIKSLLQETYCGKIGADFRDINDIDAVTWLQHEMESVRNKPEVSKVVKERILTKLTQAEGFEKFLQDRYLGQKRFSIEGLESFIPLLDTLASEAKKIGVDEVNMGMAHRGRLNVLANFLGKPYELMLQEFEGSDTSSYGIDGDVKYHKGFASNVETIDKSLLRVFLSPNPSHLEVVNPVVEGFARARQRMLGDSDRKGVLPVLVHGDAAFIGQGVVAETLNLSELDSYKTGGTIHIITNNQVGFTTNPDESRSCHYSSDIAKIVRAPVFHVNADDPEAVIWVATLALAYRQKYQKDIVIDLIGYRKHGHNETDEPSFTQPHMYKIIKAHKSVLTLYSAELAEQGVVSSEASKDMMKSFRSTLQEKLNYVREGGDAPKVEVPKELEECTILVKATEEDLLKKQKTAITKKALTEIVGQITEVPEGFTPHPKVAKLFRNRKKMIEGEGKIDWGLAECITFSSVARDGQHVRLSGQDCRRGTFSHRHAVIRDFETGASLNVLDQATEGKQTCDVINSSLSEQGVLGFEFGYSVADRNTLVMWEAQFGDFSNGAQIVIDQFLVASEAKWKQASSLVMLLPHGYEGMGPEHSSARPERYLQLCGDNNVQVANLTKPAQLFHILRRQQKRDFKKPLIIMTPKSLLRLPQCVSSIDDFVKGEFQEVIEDEFITDKSKVEKVVFTTGKLYYDLLKERDNAKDADKVAIVRLEQIYPFPEKQVQSIIKAYKNSTEVVWAQEEPSNMGAWTFIRHRLKQLITRKRSFGYIGRVSAGTTAEGSNKAHVKEQARIVKETWALGTK